MRNILVALALLSHTNLLAQGACDCSTALNLLTKKVEKEYPGFPDKTKDSLSYDSFRKQLLDLSQTTGDERCIEVLQRYTGYFKDAHLSIRRVNAATPTTATATAATGVVAFDSVRFTKYLETSKDSLEGIWRSGAYRVGTIRTSSGHTGFIISSANVSWKPTEVKFTLGPDGNAVFYMGDHSATVSTYSVLKNSILFFEYNKIAFAKELPSPPFPKEEIAAAASELQAGINIRQLGDSTLLLTLFRFDPIYTETIARLIDSNKHLLRNSRNLIIDVRGNGGGSDFSWHPLRPYLYTNPTRSLGAQYLVTQTLMDGLTNWANTASRDKYGDEVDKVKRDVARMQGKLGEFVPTSEGANYGFFTLDSVYQNPRSVVILADKRCGSSCEQFLLHAKQSKKVKVFGTPTFGVLDYSSVRRFDFACSDYALNMPTFRVMRLPEYPIDNIGIQPDVFMDRYIGDWIAYAKGYLENTQGKRP